MWAISRRASAAAASGGGGDVARYANREELSSGVFCSSREFETLYRFLRRTRRFSSSHRVILISVELRMHASGFVSVKMDEMSGFCSGYLEFFKGSVTILFRRDWRLDHDPHNTGGGGVRASALAAALTYLAYVALFVCKHGVELAACSDGVRIERDKSQSTNIPIDDSIAVCSIISRYVP